MVAEINQVATVELDLHRHLFGADRLPPKALRDGIAALQTAVLLLPAGYRAARGR